MTTAYDDHLASPQWQATRELVKHRDGYACQDCGARTGLEVHHMTYANLGHEPHTDLITVCRHCHSLRNTHWWTRVRGGGQARADGTRRDFTFDYLGPQTEWRAREWGAKHRLRMARASLPAADMMTMQEQAWHADADLQREYADALTRARAKPAADRPVRRGPRVVPAVQFPGAPAAYGGFEEALAMVLPKAAPPPRRRKGRRLRRLLTGLGILAAVYLLVVLIGNIVLALR